MESTGDSEADCSRELTPQECSRNVPLLEVLGVRDKKSGQDTAGALPMESYAQTEE